MTINVTSARLVDGQVRAVGRADSPPRAQIHLRLEFPITGPTDIKGLNEIVRTTEARPRGRLRTYDLTLFVSSNLNYYNLRYLR